MHRIDAAGYAAGNLFTDGNTSNGTPATVVDAAWLNDLQENIALVIEGAGVSLSKADHTQLRQAITKMIQAGQRAVIINNAVFAGTVTGTGKAVYWDSANSRFDLALADGTAKQSCVGFADVANSNVYAFGDAVLFSGLTPGSRYYLSGSTAGAITTTAPTNAVFIGIAKTATEVFVDVDAVGGMTQAQADARYLQLSAYDQIVGIPTPTFSAGAMTIPAPPSPFQLDFRSATLSSGAVSTVSGTPVALVVPSGATLGVVSGQQSTIALLALNNAGTIEYAVVNLAGGVDLSETGAINTTAISASATSAGVVYSATARADVAYRVIGVIVSTQTTAGTWAQSPTMVQGVGGQALTALQSIGFGQKVQDLTAARAYGTTYYNTTGRPIFVSIVATNSLSSDSSIVVDGVPTYRSGNAPNNAYTISGIIPPDASYKATTTQGTITLQRWSELR